MIPPIKRSHAVKRSKFTEQQIAYALKQAELGTPVEEVCRKMGISDATFYNWKKKYGGLGPSEVRRRKQWKKRTPSSKSWWQTCHSIRPCYRTYCQKSSEAFPQAAAD